MAGYLGAAAPHALIISGLTLCSLGIAATSPPHPSRSCRIAGAWCVVLSIALVAGVTCGTHARARTRLADRIDGLVVHRIDGRVARASHTASRTLLSLRRWRIATPRLDLHFNAPLQVSVPHTAAARGHSVTARTPAPSSGIRSSVSSRGPVFYPPAVTVSGTPDVLGRTRSAVARALTRAGGRAAGLLTALVLGDTSALDPALSTRFARSGTLHLLALSGMHLGVFALIAGLVGRAIGGPRVGLALTAVVVAFYIALVGARPGLVRAALLVTVSVAGRSTGRRLALADALAGAFLLHLVLDPSGLYSVGFQLSYLSLLGIATMTPVIRHLLNGRVPDLVLAPLAAGMGAQIATLPVVLLAFGRVSLLGSVATLVMAPLVTILMLAGPLLAAAAALLPALAVVSRFLLGLAYDALLLISGRFSHGPVLAASADSPAPVVGAVVASVAVCAALAVRYRFEYHPSQLWRGRI